MTCYKDTTFCASETENHTCGRELSDIDHNRAQAFDMAVCYGYFCGEPASKEQVAEAMEKVIEEYGDLLKRIDD